MVDASCSSSFSFNFSLLSPPSECTKRDCHRLLAFLSFIMPATEAYTYIYMALHPDVQVSKTLAIVAHCATGGAQHRSQISSSNSVVVRYSFCSAFARHRQAPTQALGTSEMRHANLSMSMSMRCCGQHRNECAGRCIRSPCFESSPRQQDRW